MSSKLGNLVLLTPADPSGRGRGRGRLPTAMPGMIPYGAVPAMGPMGGAMDPPTEPSGLQVRAEL